jgi:hypothetical protein
MRNVTGALWAFVALFSSIASSQETHEDPKLGFKIRAPRDFQKIPVQPDEEWIVARWLSDRAYFQKDTTTGYSMDHKPEMHVIAFVDAVVNAERVEVEKKTDDKTATVKIRIKNPYKDYRDYLKKTYSEGGFYIDKEEKTEVEGVKVECLEIKVEKLTWGGPRRIVTWIFDAPYADFAVQFELVETAWPKLKNEVLSSLRSFRLIDRTGASAATTGGNAPVVIDLDAEFEDLTPSARARARRDQETKWQEKATEGLIGGWKSKRMGRVFVIYDVDEKDAQEFATDATVVLDWLDEQFAWLGPGEYVRQPTIRICKDSDEENMYRKGGSFWSWTNEIVTHKDTDRGWSYTEGGYVNSSVARHWFQERSGELWSVMPWWLHSGLDDVFQKSRAKGKKLEFYNDSWERVDIAEQIRTGKLSPLRELVKLDSDQVFKDKEYNKVDEFAAAVRFFLTGPKKAKETLKTYLQALLPLARKRDEERKAALAAGAKSTKPKTEEEEDAEFKEANTKMRDEEKRFLEEAYNKAFGAWTDADWKSLEASYQKSLK